MYETHLDLTPEQQLFQKTCRDFLEKEFPLPRVRSLFDDPRGFSAELWRHQAELGWFGLLVPDQQGGEDGAGDGVVELALVAGEVGRLVQPGPVLPTNVVADAIRAAGSAGQRAGLLALIASGEMVATWCLGEPEFLWNRQPPPVRLSRRAGSPTLDGCAAYVQDAAAADVLLVTAADGGGLTQVLVPAGSPGVHVEPMECLDLARRLARVHFREVAVPADALVGSAGGARADIERQLDLALVLQNAETVGALDRVFELTLQYAKDRVAFGRPIGSFQAIKHRLADLTVLVESCKATSEAAARALADRSDRARELISIAKAYIAQHAPGAVQECVQIHGGIGVTWDHDLHLYLRRVTANAALYGTPDSHRERLVSLLTTEATPTAEMT